MQSTANTRNDAAALARVVAERSAEITTLVAEEHPPAVLILDGADPYAADLLVQLRARGAEPDRTIFACDFPALTRLAPPHLRAETGRSIEAQRARLRPGEIVIAGMVGGAFTLTVASYVRTGDKPTTIGEA